MQWPRFNVVATCACALMTLVAVLVPLLMAARGRVVFVELMRPGWGLPFPTEVLLQPLTPLVFAIAPLVLTGAAAMTKSANAAAGCVVLAFVVLVLGTLIASVMFCTAFHDPGFGTFVWLKECAVFAL